MSRAPSEERTATTEKDARDPSPPPVDEDPPALPPIDGDPRRDLISERTLLYRRLRMLQKEIVSFIIYFIDVILIVDTLVSTIGLPQFKMATTTFSLSFYTLNELLFLPDCSEDLILTWRLILPEQLLSKSESHPKNHQKSHFVQS